MSSARSRYDVVIVGGGHNGLVSATYLARAGLSVLVLERLPQVGGAAGSTELFSGHPVRLPRYASAVAPMPESLIADLDLDIDLAPVPRTISSYTPTARDGRPGGLLVQRPAKRKTEKSFRALTGSDQEYAAWRELESSLAALAQVVSPTLLQPLPVEREIRDRVDPEIWRDFVTRPLGETIEARFTDDTVRGVASSLGIVGSFTGLHDASLQQNRGFLYHQFGSATDDRLLPVGGMAAVTRALARTATEAGAEIITNAGVSTIDADRDGAEVTWHDGAVPHTVAGRYVLSNVAPWVLTILLGEAEDAGTKPEGSQLTITMLLDRLPRLSSGVDSEVAFAGALQLGHGYAEINAAYDEARAGRVPSVLPARVHCEPLDGLHALTYVGGYVPASLFDADPGAKEAAVSRALASLDEHLVDPVASYLATDAAGRPCLLAKTPQEIERDLAMPGGHIFHGDLEWPWATNRARLDTPAAQWGVQTDIASVLVCGSGSRRGGAISGLGGHSAAQAVLASI